MEKSGQAKHRSPTRVLGSLNSAPAEESSRTTRSSKKKHQQRQNETMHLLPSFVRSKVVSALGAGLLCTMGIAFMAERPDVSENFFLTPPRGLSNASRSLRTIKRAIAPLSSLDLGGSHRVQHPKRKLKVPKNPDYGSLEFDFFASEYDSRLVWDKGIGPGPYIRDTRHPDITTDDEYYLQEEYIYNDEDNSDRHCRYPKLNDMAVVTCNFLHEFGFEGMARSGVAEKVG
jgi:hypothetical protein